VLCLVIIVNILLMLCALTAGFHRMRLCRCRHLRTVPEQRVHAVDLDVRPARVFLLPRAQQPELRPERSQHRECVHQPDTGDMCVKSHPFPCFCTFSAYTRVLPPIIAIGFPRFQDCDVAQQNTKYLTTRIKKEHFTPVFARLWQNMLVHHTMISSLHRTTILRLPLAMQRGRKRV
jgi:hypothetical protein